MNESFDASGFVKSEFDKVIQQRGIALSKTAEQTITNAIALTTVDDIVSKMIQRDADKKRRIRIVSDDLGRLARSLANTIAIELASGTNEAEAISEGFIRWRGSNSFVTMANRYHK